MSDTPFNANFFEQFLDDYFAESDEHVRSVRRNLLNLEDSLSAGAPIEKSILNDLFRSFHTLKGISGMAAVAEVETLAHYLESYLRLLRDERAVLSQDGLLALIRSTQKIEDIILARRQNEPAPEFENEIDELKPLLAESSEERVIARTQTNEHAPASSIYKFTFTSAAELAGRNININQVRERLKAIGTIRRSTPVISGEGRIAFEFEVETDAAEETFADWPEDGITFERMEDGPDALNAERPAATVAAAPHSPVVRVELSRLDDLMLMIGELVVSRARLAEQIRLIERDLPSARLDDLQQINHVIERQLRSLRDGVMRSRMTPIGEVFERLRFAVRDLARELGKKVTIDIAGEHTEIDKLLVERVLDPMLHLVRNSVSHGIESPEVRIAAGKPEEGLISLHAETAGETIVLEVADDGAGIDRADVARRARERGLIEFDVTDDASLLEILCTPGFSTRDEADKASGRGVGMDVVRRAVDELGGRISIETKRGGGTAFRIEVPLTLAIADALIVAVDSERFAVPQSTVREVIEISRDAVHKLENNEIFEYRGFTVPIVRLSKLFALEDKYRDVFHAFIVGEGKQAVAVGVDRVIGQTEIVVRAINDPLAQVPGISGATELGDGRIVLILDVSAVTRRLRQTI